MYTGELKAFIQAAECGSFGKAAKKLYVSPTAVMKQMNQLEDRLGLQLFKRTNHGIQLTECGESLYKDAKYIISYSEKALERAKQISRSSSQVLRVGTSMLNPCKVFMDLWYQVNDRFPGFKIQVVPFEDNHDGIPSVIEQFGEKFDFVVGVCDSAKWLEQCSFYRLGMLKKCVSVSSNHRLVKKKILDITDLYGETLMMVRKGDSPVNDKIRRELIQNHPRIQIEDTAQFYDIEVFNRCEETGNVLLNIECWADVHPSLVTIPVNWNYAISYGLIYSKTPSRAVAEFLDVLKADKQ